MIATTQDDALYSLPCPQAVAAKLDLPDDLIGYFSLFLVREKEDGAFSCEFLWTFCFLLFPVVNLPPCLPQDGGIFLRASFPQV